MCVSPKVVVFEPVWFEKGIEFGNFDLSWVYNIVTTSLSLYYASLDRCVMEN